MNDADSCETVYFLVVKSHCRLRTKYFCVTVSCKTVKTVLVPLIHSIIVLHFILNKYHHSYNTIVSSYYLRGFWTHKSYHI